MVVRHVHLRGTQSREQTKKATKNKNYAAILNQTIDPLLSFLLFGYWHAV